VRVDAVEKKREVKRGGNQNPIPYQKVKKKKDGKGPLFGGGGKGKVWGDFADPKNIEKGKKGCPLNQTPT